MEGKNYSKLVKTLQIAAGVFMLAMVVACVILIRKYDIKVTNIPRLAEMIQGGTLVLAAGIILFSVVKSFALVFPPAVVFAICGYLMPDYWIALAINIISVGLSLFAPYFLGRFTGAGIVDSMKTRFKAVKKLDDFKGANETTMTFAIKLSGIIPSDLSSLLFGAINVSFRNYIIGAGLGMVPLAIVYTAFGVALKNVGEKPWVAVIPVAIIVVFVLIASLITKRVVAKTKAQQTKENE
ncbi:MAG: TVP38/TMEM64 family protein [Clostridia bacterium]|nr:TVP38/TMEM64 family protein [Clostridia bacterium]